MTIGFKNCKKKNQKNGGRGLCPLCYWKLYRKEIMSPEVRARRRKAKNLWLARRQVRLRVEYRKLTREIKNRLGCADCGIKDWRVLDFDHLGDKKHQISRMSGFFQADKILAEIQKCEVRCANCHRIKTIERKNNTT